MAETLFEKLNRQAGARVAAQYKLAAMVEERRTSPEVISYTRRRAAALRGRAKA